MFSWQQGEWLYENQRNKPLLPYPPQKQNMWHFWMLDARLFLPVPPNDKAPHWDGNVQQKQATTSFNHSAALYYPPYGEWLSPAASQSCCSQRERLQPCGHHDSSEDNTTLTQNMKVNNHSVTVTKPEESPCLVIDLKQCKTDDHTMAYGMNTALGQY
jgi:hypothetical protein